MCPEIDENDEIEADEREELKIRKLDEDILSSEFIPTDEQSVFYNGANMIDEEDEIKDPLTEIISAYENLDGPEKGAILDYLKSRFAEEKEEETLPEIEDIQVLENIVSDLKKYKEAPLEVEINGKPANILITRSDNSSINFKKNKEKLILKRTTIDLLDDIGEKVIEQLSLDKKYILTVYNNGLDENGNEDTGISLSVSKYGRLEKICEVIANIEKPPKDTTMPYHA